jgi:hemolysin type calcium-binding protein
VTELEAQRQAPARFAPCLLIALAAVLALGLRAPSAAAAPLQQERASVIERGACTGPCPLLVYRKGSGTGVVRSSPEGIDCGTVCDSAFDEFSPVTLRAIPSGGSSFLGWENCPSTSSQGECLIPANSSLAICATFVPVGSPPAPASPCPPQTVPPPPPRRTGPPPPGLRCTIPGSPTGDTIRGTPGDDVICGRGGNDRIYGGGGHDLLVGGGGADRVYGQAGFDRLVGDAGADVFFARDGVRDVVSGGAGRDRARVDRVDALKGLERRF